MSIKRESIRRVRLAFVDEAGAVRRQCVGPNPGLQRAAGARGEARIVGDLKKTAIKAKGGNAINLDNAHRSPALRVQPGTARIRAYAVFEFSQFPISHEAAVGKGLLR